MQRRVTFPPWWERTEPLHLTMNAILTLGDFTSTAGSRQYLTGALPFTGKLPFLGVWVEWAEMAGLGRQVRGTGGAPGRYSKACVSSLSLEERWKSQPAAHWRGRERKESWGRRRPFQLDRTHCKWWKSVINLIRQASSCPQRPQAMHSTWAAEDRPTATISSISHLILVSTVEGLSEDSEE